MQLRWLGVTVWPRGFGKANCQRHALRQGGSVGPVSSAASGRARRGRRRWGPWHPPQWAHRSNPLGSSLVGLFDLTKWCCSHFGGHEAWIKLGSSTSTSRSHHTNHQPPTEPHSSCSWTLSRSCRPWKSLTACQNLNRPSCRPLDRALLNAKAKESQVQADLVEEGEDLPDDFGHALSGQWCAAGAPPEAAGSGIAIAAGVRLAGRSISRPLGVTRQPRGHWTSPSCWRRRCPVDERWGSRRCRALQVAGFS